MMRGKRSTTGLILAVALVLSTRSAVVACECGWIVRGEDGKPGWGSAPPLEADDVIREAVVLLGQVIDVRDGTFGSPGVLKSEVTIRVERYWKGKVERTIQVYGGFGIDCGFSFAQGERYVVFADRATKADRASRGVPEDALLVSTCSRTAAAKDSQDLIDRLNRFRGGKVPRDRAASSGQRLDAPQSGVTALAQSRKRRRVRRSVRHTR